MPQSRADYPVEIEIPVQWGEMDAAKHVNNVVYLRWVESARLAYFERMDMDMSFEGGAPGPILGWQDCKYIFPVKYPDVIYAATRTLEVREDRLVLETALFSQRHDRLVAFARQHIVPFSYQTQRKVPLPTQWTAAVQRLEGI